MAGPRQAVTTQSPISPGRSDGRRNSLTDEAYRVLRRRIIRCEMPPGMRITEAQLVEQLGIGKTPVREAVARLVQEGLIHNTPPRGQEVSPVTLHDVHEIFSLRMVIEPATVEMAARRVDPDQLRRLDELCAAAGYAVGDDESLEQHHRANREFHVMVAHATGNRRLTQITARLMDESERMFHLGLMFHDRSDEVRHEHRALVDALIAGDGERARQIAVDGIEAARRMVIEALLRSPSVQRVRVEPPPAWNGEGVLPV